ncbi:hypothetical protein MOQ72_23550 [Saccharopolyspora sp. K220]|uniref:hypothetical protein n=1 Tax=Saccharopolyspora soli TaxID=2926618 RepID=UPI001F57C970|nr:hypothetical protein [Saccharopolyspora soli]MCI2420427.1 hypothetical protein [Saccharopolyspora soli]
MSQPPWQGNRYPQEHGPPPQPPQAQYGPTPPQAPRRPGVVLAAAVLGGLVALIIVGVAVFTLVAGWSGASGGGEIVVVLLAFIIGGVGAMHALGVASLLHPRFPSTARMAMAGWTTMAVVAFGAFRSVRGLAETGPDFATLLVWIVLAVVVITLMVLITRPAVAQWVQATHAHSRRLGHVPKQRRR